MVMQVSIKYLEFCKTKTIMLHIYTHYTITLNGLLYFALYFWLYFALYFWLSRFVSSLRNFFDRQSRDGDVQHNWLLETTTNSWYVHVADHLSILLPSNLERTRFFIHKSNACARFYNFWSGNNSTTIACYCHDKSRVTYLRKYFIIKFWKYWFYFSRIFLKVCDFKSKFLRMPVHAQK